MAMLKGTKLDKLRETERVFLEQEIKHLQEGFCDRDVEKLKMSQERLKNMYEGLSDEGQENAKVILRALNSALQKIKQEEYYDD